MLINDYNRTIIDNAIITYDNHTMHYNSIAWILYKKNDLKIIPTGVHSPELHPIEFFFALFDKYARKNSIRSNNEEEVLNIMKIFKKLHFTKFFQRAINEYHRLYSE